MRAQPLRIAIVATALLALACASGPRHEDPTRELSPSSFTAMEGMEDPNYRVGFELAQLVPDRVERFNRGSLVVAPGNYGFLDFVKVGLPLLVLTWATTLLVTPIFFPF